MDNFLLGRLVLELITFFLRRSSQTDVKGRVKQPTFYKILSFFCGND